MIKLAMLKRKLQCLREDYKNKKITAEKYFCGSPKLEEKIKEGVQLVANAKLLEGTLEAIPQLMILSSLIFFWRVYFVGYKGRYTIRLLLQCLTLHHQWSQLESGCFLCPINDHVGCKYHANRRKKDN